MLMEIAAANAIFKTLSTALGNGKSLYDMGAQLASYFSAGHAIQAKAGTKDSTGTALECFLYREEQARQREQLRFHLNKSRLCAWTDFVKFEAEWHRDRKEEELALRKAQARKRLKLQQDIQLAIHVGTTLLLATGLLFGIAIYYKG